MSWTWNRPDPVVLFGCHEREKILKHRRKKKKERKKKEETNSVDCLRWMLSRTNDTKTEDTTIASLWQRKENHGKHNQGGKRELNKKRKNQSFLKKSISGDSKRTMQERSCGLCLNAVCALFPFVLHGSFSFDFVRAA
jgi:hypothetical protein